MALGSFSNMSILTKFSKSTELNVWNVVFRRLLDDIFSNEFACSSLQLKWTVFTGLRVEWIGIWSDIGLIVYVRHLSWNNHEKKWNIGILAYWYNGKLAISVDSSSIERMENRMKQLSIADDITIILEQSFSLECFSVHISIWPVMFGTWYGACDLWAHTIYMHVF